MSAYTSTRRRYGLEVLANQILHTLIVGLALLSVALVAVPVAERYSPSPELALVIAIALVLTFKPSSKFVH